MINEINKMSEEYYSSILNHGNGPKKLNETIEKNVENTIKPGMISGFLSHHRPTNGVKITYIIAGTRNTKPNSIGLKLS